MFDRVAWILGWLVPAALAQAQSVTLHYQERPPYSSLDAGGKVAGLVATPAAEALQAAGIDYEWQQTPSQRQLALIQSGKGLHCGVGWFHNDERAALGKFSRPLYRDRPFGVLAREALGLPDVVAADRLLADPRLKLLVKEGYSYGEALDGMIARQQQRTVSTSAEPFLMSQMLRSGRADWMIVAPEEGQLAVGQGLRLLRLAGMPDGQSRHLYCSGDLPDAWLARIDEALMRRTSPPVPR